MPAIDVFIRMTTIQDKVIHLSKVRKCLIAFKSDLRALLTMFDIKTTDDSDLDIFYMNRDVLIGAIGEQLCKYTDAYKVFESIEVNAHLISFGSTLLESDPNKWFMDIMGNTSDPIRWGRNLFYPFPLQMGRHQNSAHGKGRYQ